MVPSTFSLGSSTSPARAWSRGRELAQQWDLAPTPLRLGVEGGGGSGRALGQLAGEATAGLGKGVPTSPRSSSPALPPLATGDPQEPWGSPINSMPRDISSMGNQLPWSFSKALTSLVPLTKRAPSYTPSNNLWPQAISFERHLPASPQAMGINTSLNPSSKKLLPI